MVAGQEAAPLDRAAGPAGRDELRQQVAEQQVGRGLGAHVHVVAHRDALRGEGEHVDRAADRPATADSTGRRRRAGTPAARPRAGVSRPNQATSPGPWPSGAYAGCRPPRCRPTSTGVAGRSRSPSGRRRPCSLAGSQPHARRTPAARRRSSTSAAQPSATTAARIDRRSGSHTSAQLDRRAAVQQRPAGTMPGTTSRGRAHVDQQRHAGVEPAQHLGVGRVDRARPRRRTAGAARRPRARSPPAGIRQSTCSTGTPWLATASANSGSPTLTTATSLGQLDVGLRSGSLIVRLRGGRAVTARRLEQESRSARSKSAPPAARPPRAARPRPRRHCSAIACTRPRAPRRPAGAAGRDDLRRGRAPRSGPRRSGPSAVPVCSRRRRVEHRPPVIAAAQARAGSPRARRRRRPGTRVR